MTLDNKLSELMENPQALAVLNKHLGDFTSNPMLSMAMSMSLKQIANFAAGKISEETLAAVEKDLAEISG